MVSPRPSAFSSPSSSLLPPLIGVGCAVCVVVAVVGAVDVQVPSVDLEAWDANDFNESFDKNDAKSAALVHANANKAGANHLTPNPGAGAQAAAGGSPSKPGAGAAAAGAKGGAAGDGRTALSPDEDDLLDPSLVSAVGTDDDSGADAPDEPTSALSLTADTPRPKK